MSAEEPDVPPAGEPSLDEILASIKQVIEREREAIGNAPAAPPSAPALLGDPADILDLGEAGVVLHGDGGMEPAVSWFAAEGGPSRNPLAGAGAAASVRQSLATLEALGRSLEQRSIAAPGELSLEQLARAMLRPMLASWLDSHLPPLVERLVREEIARILRRPGE